MLVAESLVKRFRDPARGTVLAVDHLTLQVQPGEVLGLLGPNGAGKTTTLRMLATLLRPDEGSVVIDGLEVAADPVAARARLAYVPAEAGLPPRMTGREVVRLFAKVQGVADAASRTESLLALLGASAFADSATDALSTGQKRRIVLARALVHDPPVLLLDEPTDGLDVAGRREVLELVRRLAGEGRAVLLSSHIMGEVDVVCGRAAVVARGRKVAEGTLSELRSLAGTHDLSDAFLHLVQLGEVDPEPA